MAIIKKLGDGYYLCKKKRGLYKGNHIVQEKWINIFRVRADSYKSGTLSVISRNIHAPKELVGKKIMLKVIVIEDKKKFRFEDLEEIYG